MEQELGQRFRASEIVTLIYDCYFRRPKMRGNRDEKFFERINAVFVWIAGFIHAHLNSYVIWYRIHWRTTVHVDFHIGRTRRKFDIQGQKQVALTWARSMPWKLTWTVVRQWMRYVVYLSCAKATANIMALHCIQCTLAIAELINRCKRFTITIALTSL